MPPAGAPGRLEIHIKSKSFRAASGGRLHVLGELSISLGNGEVAALVGPSGCGKTTLLRIVVGLDRDFEGSVRLPAHGKLGIVFQEPRLLPWRTVEQNVRLAAPGTSDAKLTQLLQILELEAHRGHFPGELSLGLARRVALARAFAVEPDLLVLDEPLASLDDALAGRLREEIATLVEGGPVMTLLVTHSLDDAIRLGDRLFFLSPRPARLLNEVPIGIPRNARGEAEIAAIKAGLVRRIQGESAKRDVL